MCDVTKENFFELFPKIKSCIEEAAFVAIDGEFTGLSTSLLNEPTLFDTPEARYKKLKQSLGQFLLCQCGISFFIPDKNKNRYIAHTFNFYVFPHSYGPIDTRFSCQASAMEFLTNHGFDFNLLIKGGIPYLNLDQLKLLQKYHAEGLVQQHMNSSYVRQLDESFIGSATEMLHKFVNQTDIDTLTTDFIPKGITQYLLLNFIEKHFPQLSCSVQSDGLVVIKKSDGNFDFEEQYKKLFEFAFGFSRVFQLISQLKKPLVGHNLLSDLVFIYGQFCQNLPDSYEKFKTSVNKVFPKIYDTKHISIIIKTEFQEINFFKITTLKHLYDSFTSPTAIFFKLFTPTVIHASDSNKYQNLESPHEAGYDAYMTGYLFLRFAHLLASKNVSSMNSHALEPHEHLSAIKHLENLVYVSRANVSYFNFNGKDPSATQPERFIVTFKDQKSKFSLAQIARDFLPFGSVDVQLIDYKQAVVAVSHKRRAQDIIKAFSKHKFYTVTRYDWIYHLKSRIFLWYLLMITGGLTTGGVLWASFRKK